MWISDRQGGSRRQPPRIAGLRRAAAISPRVPLTQPCQTKRSGTPSRPSRSAPLPGTGQQGAHARPFGGLTLRLRTPRYEGARRRPSRCFGRVRWLGPRSGDARAHAPRRVRPHPARWSAGRRQSDRHRRPGPGLQRRGRGWPAPLRPLAHPERRDRQPRGRRQSPKRPTTAPLSSASSGGSRMSGRCSRCACEGSSGFGSMPI